MTMTQATELPMISSQSFQVRSQRLGGVGASLIRDMTRQAHDADAVNLGQGLSRLPPPAELLAELARISASPVHSYGGARGNPRLRETWARFQNRLEGSARYDPADEIVVTVGATGAYSATLAALTDPGDGILLIEPFYSYHRDLANLLGLRVFSVATDPFDDKPLSYEDLSSAFEECIRAVVICTPGNPSGRLLDPPSLDAVSRFVGEKNILLVTDETYQCMIFGPHPHISPASRQDLRSRSVTISSLSKLLSIPGWRLGFASASPDLAASISKAADLLSVCPPTALQVAVAQTLDSLSMEYLTKMNEELRLRMGVVRSFFDGLGLQAKVPDGAYYLLIDCESIAASGCDAAHILLHEHGVATIPGEAFHIGAPRRAYVRACFAVTDDEIETLKRMTKNGRTD